MGDTTVRSYTRNGHTVHAHTRDTPNGSGPGDHPDDDPRAQRKRHAFERRVLAERQRAEATYGTESHTPGERKPERKKTAEQKSRQHWKRGRRIARKKTWRRAFHHAAAGAYGAAAAGRWVGQRLKGEWS